MVAKDQEPCPWCNMLHKNQRCSQVKAIEYFEDGKIKRVEFMTALDYYPLPIVSYSGQHSLSS